MNNFLEFIEKDIEAKKILISTLPTKTKANKKKFNENIDSILKKYIEYKKCLKNYLLAKSRSLTIKEKEEDLEKLNDNISKLEHARFVLNPTNTYFEKMGFGPVTKNYEDTVNEIVKAIDNGCKKDKKYISRVNSFFKYFDDNNCKRIYEEILKKRE